MRTTAEVPKRDGIHPLTQIILLYSPYFGSFSSASTAGLRDCLRVLQKAYALHLSHAFALVIVNAVAGR
jgi:hypothetical protein